MSISALNWAFGVRDVAVSQKVVLIALANFSDEAGYSFPAINTIAKMSCLSDRSVRRALADLVETGFLKIDHRFRGDGSQSSSGYFLQVTPPVNLTPPPDTLSVPPVTGDTPYNLQLTTTSLDNKLSSKPKRKSRIKADWIPTEFDWQYARSLGLLQKEIDNEATEFKQYYLSKGTAWLDWGIVWKRWIGRYIKSRGGEAGRPNSVRDNSKPQTFLGETIRLIKERESNGYGG
jgi:hypothetical protein